MERGALPAHAVVVQACIGFSIMIRLMRLMFHLYASGAPRMDKQTRSRQVQEHLDAIAKLHAQEMVEGEVSNWPPRDYYLLYHVVVGMMLGFIGATSSLLFNVAGALLTGQPPLKLIQVYLTFPMGEQALTLTSRSDQSVVLFVGCCLYLITGSVYGVIFHVIISRFFGGKSLVARWIIGTVMGLALWITNFYFILSWLQPLLQGEAYIIRSVPFWVAALTHIVFAWTMLIVEFWGKFESGASSTLGLKRGAGGGSWSSGAKA